MKDNFITYHPVINFIYFLIIILLSVFILNPLFSGISLICGFTYAILLKGKQVLKFGLLLIIPLIIISMMINPIVNPRGATVLFDLPFDLGPATLESTIYGFSTGLMIASVIVWFICFNMIITSDRLTFLFGRILPSSSLIFVMILRFVPRYREQIKTINEAQESIGMGIGTGSRMQKVKNGTRILSIMFTWALENAIQTADSMKARGYGLKNRTSFMMYRFTFSDKLVAVIMAILFIGTICAAASGVMNVEYFPFFELAFTTGGHINLLIFGSGCGCFTLFAMIPIFLSLQEMRYWSKAEDNGDNS